MSAYHTSRSLHRWVGAIGSLFLITLAVTGFLLANKGKFGWMRPPEVEGMVISSLNQTISLERAAEAAFALGIKELRTFEDIDRIDYRPGSNIFKVISNEGYHEIQVDGTTGKVLSRSFRRDQLTEDIHDLSYFAGWLKDWGLPVVAIFLFTLGLTGIVIFTTPFYRRWKFRNKKPGEVKKAG